jgi:hypothetical protein
VNHEIESGQAMQQLGQKIGCVLAITVTKTVLVLFLKAGVLNRTEQEQFLQLPNAYFLTTEIICQKMI